MRVGGANSKRECEVMGDLLTLLLQHVPAKDFIKCKTIIYLENETEVETVRDGLWWTTQETPEQLFYLRQP